MAFRVAYSYETKIVGVTHTNTDGRSRQQIIKKFVKSGSQLRFVREPRNPYDKSAISVWLVGGEQIGYLSRYRAGEHAHFIDKGSVMLSGKVLEVTGGGFIFKRNYGVNIEVDVLEKD